MFEKAETEFQTLTEKKRIVNNDKAKIEKVICLSCSTQDTSRLFRGSHSCTAWPHNESLGI